MFMADLEFGSHARDMVQERNIPEEWVQRTLNSPDRTETAEDGTIHYIKAIREREGRFLRVVVNPRMTPKRVITVFLDRRLGRQR